MADPGAILGVDDDPEKISDQVLFAVPQIIAPKPIHRGRGISPWVGGQNRPIRGSQELIFLNRYSMPSL